MTAGILFPRDAREGPAGQEMTSPALDENVRGQRDSGGDGEDVHGAHNSNLPPNTLMGKRWIGRSSAAPGGSSPVIGLTMPQARAGWIDFTATRWPGTTPSTGSRGPIPDPHLEPRTGANGNGFVGLIGFATALGGSGGAKLLPPAVSYAGLLLSFRGRWNTRMG